jgi:hypothetical protein
MTSPARSMPAKSGEDAGRGLPSSRRFAQALTATPLRPAMALRFARMVRDEPYGGCHATHSNTQ